MPIPLLTSNDNAHDNCYNPQVPLLIRKSSRQNKPPTYLQHYHCNLISNTIPVSEAYTPNSSSQCMYSLLSFLSYDVLSSAHKYFTLNIYAITKPQSMS